MKSTLFSRYILLLIIVSFIAGCRKDRVEPTAVVLDNFESGSIGLVSKLSETSWELSLADDNDNADLPNEWRTWWYVRIDNVSDKETVNFTIKNNAWPYYYLPVYSYDQKNWLRFSEDEVSQNTSDELIIQKKFEATTVWMARFYPYAFSDLKYYMSTIQGSPFLEIQTPGYTQKGNPIHMFKITNFGVPITRKKRVFIHARTHPAETPSSFVIEGLVDFLLEGSAQSREILSKAEFYIFPMQNVDGVIAGNYRTTTQSENLEVMWYYDPLEPMNLKNEAPSEVKVIHQFAKNLMQDGGSTISVALNLHASNSEPDTRTFFFPHFGSSTQGYAPEEASLWEKQLNFISSFAGNFGSDMVEPLPLEGGSSFASKTYPESWWWVNYKDQVMAITMEMTYGRSGFSPRWIEPVDMKAIGRALALGINDYCNPLFKTPYPIESIGKNRSVNLKYPFMYPPDDSDELKE